MCDPVTLAIGSAAISGLGSVVNGYEQNQTQNAMIEARNRATQQELARQRQFQQESAQQFQNTMDKFQPEQQAKDLTTQQQTATQNFDAATPKSNVTADAFVSPNAPKVVQDAANKSVGDVFSRAGGLNTALGGLAGYGQTFFNNNLNLNSSARKLATTSDLARTSAAVNGLEQNAAYRNAYRPNSGIGDVLQFAGNVGAYGSGRGYFNPATKTVSPTFDLTAGTGAVF